MEIFNPNCVNNEDLHFKTPHEYRNLYDYSVSNSDKFWEEQSKCVEWFSPFTSIKEGTIESNNLAWFKNGKINACYNCVDRHLHKNSNKIAIIWEGDSETDIRKITYKELHRQTCLLANTLIDKGVKKGDIICIYMPMIPEAAYAMLACARIGAVHNVIFAGFNVHALKNRIQNSNCKIIITSDFVYRGGKSINLINIVKEAVKNCKIIQKVLLWKRGSKDLEFNKSHVEYFILQEEMKNKSAECSVVKMDSEDPLFMLYTSGSTGKPKGLIHTTGGYLVYVTVTHKYIFNYKNNDIYACMADIGWITGHSYVIYGPLSNNATTFMFESTPIYPNTYRYFSMIERHRINSFYTSPTAIRLVQKYDQELTSKFDLSSLKVIGSVGEPINTKAWHYYYNRFGQKRCIIVDTYWQTETGGIVITPIPGDSIKPGSANSPFLGIEPAILDPKSGKLLKGNDVKGVLCIKNLWPGIARTIFNDHKKYLETYFNVYNGYYFTGDLSYRDHDGHYFILGRNDDVLSISGHRIGTSEIETAINMHKDVIESAVVSVPHDIKGSSIFAFIVLIDERQSKDINKEVNNYVRKLVGHFVSVDHITNVNELPKTRSGKIVRRVLRKIANHEINDLGDLSTISNKENIQNIIKITKEYYVKK